MYSTFETDAPIVLDEAFVEAVLRDHTAIVERSQTGQPIRTGNAPYAVARTATVQPWSKKSK